jgi:ubiquinone/menaquinone biosynthesis C-methylase UbiE
MGFDRARQDLIEQANIDASHKILDVGCGTGTLAVQLKQLYPAAQVVGLDPDPKALRRAKVKIQRAAVSVVLDQGFADELPYETETFDRVFSSFMFHHLEERERERALREVLRVLRPGGSFHLVDFTHADGHGSDGFWERLLGSHAHMKDNSDERILEQMRQAGFTNAVKLKDAKMLFGLLRPAFYRANHGTGLRPGETP